MQNLQDIVLPFYTKALTVNTSSNPAEIMGSVLADSFQSINVGETKGKAQLIGQVQGFWKLIPNLKWEPQEVLQNGNRVIVRSLASGNPQGNFMGIDCDGSKAFKVMTIDIHTVENNQVVQVYHLEEWTTAMKQLKS